MSDIYNPGIIQLTSEDGSVTFLPIDGEGTVIDLSAHGSGGGAVSSVSNADGSLTISPTTGAVVASLNPAHANTWTGLQTFSISNLSITGGTSGYVLSTNGTGTLSWVAQSGGGGSPGGSTSNIQYNLSGSFAGAASLNANGEAVFGGVSSTAPLSLVMGGTINVIMTSDNTPFPYIASASSEINIVNQAWQAFDQNIHTNWIPNTTSNEYLQLDFGAGASATLTQYAITTAQGVGGGVLAPASWTFSGSHDGSTFTTLDTQSAQVFADNQQKTYALSGSPTYRIYRLTVLTNGGGSLIALSELTLTGTVLLPFFIGANSAINFSNVLNGPTATFDTLVATDTFTCQGLVISSFLSGAFINLPITGASGIGSGTGNSNPWIAYAAGTGYWFGDAAQGDLAYRNTSGRLLFGATGVHSQMAVSNTTITVYPISNGNIPLTIQGFSSQSGDLTQWQNSSAAVLLSISGIGDLTTIKSVPYSWPSSNAAGQLTNNGSGALTWAPGSSGTVTSVSVTTANGVSGTIATATTTPAITLTLGAITPSSVAATGTVTGSNLSGTNTGDQTNIAGNAGTVTGIYAPTAADLTSQTTGVSSVVTITSPNDGVKHQYRLGIYTNITAISLDVLVAQATYTDENGASQTINFFPMGLTSANLASVGAFSFPDTTIRVNPNTAIIIKTSLTTGTGSISYDVGGNITRIN